MNKKCIFFILQNQGLGPYCPKNHTCITHKACVKQKGGSNVVIERLEVKGESGPNHSIVNPPVRPKASIR